MSKKGVINTILLSILGGFITYLIKVPYTIMFIGVLYCFMGMFLLINREIYTKIKSIINVDFFKEYNKKDNEFKTYIKDNSASYILIGGVLIYLGFRIKNFNFSNIYVLAVPIIIILNYLIEIYAMKTSKTWLDYRKKTGMLYILLTFMLLIFL